MTTMATCTVTWWGERWRKSIQQKKTEKKIQVEIEKERYGRGAHTVKRHWSLNSIRSLESLQAVKIVKAKERKSGVEP